MILEGEYPDTWEEFVGQELAKRTLRIATRSAKLRGKNLSHVLLKSPYAGIGKTALALLCAGEMDTQVVTISGALKVHEVPLLFDQLDDGDILFYDEIHKVMDAGKAHAEWLLHYLENGVLMTPLGAEKVPQVTIIGATTDAGRLPVPILQRFGIQPQLVPYSDEEGAQIALAMARKVLGPLSLPLPHPEVAMGIAHGSSNRPRFMRRLLESLRDLVIVGELDGPEDGKYDLTEALVMAGLTHDGLPLEAQRYLYVLAVEMRNAPTGKVLLQERLGEVAHGLTQIETLLLDKGLIAKTKQGRMLTSDGRRRAATLGTVTI